MTSTTGPATGPASEPTPSPDSDLDLIERARDAGDEPAIEELYRRHSGAALRLARQLSDPVTAEDIVAEAFARVLQALRVGKGPTSAFRPYFLTTVRNVYVTHVRQDSRHVWTADHPEVGLDPLVPDPTSQRADSQLLATAFSSLPNRWQVVLWHTAVEGEDHATVGRLLGIKANAVAALSFRAREGLRKAYLAAHLAAAPADECRPVIEQLPVYLRGGLGRRQRAEVEEHLDTCRECSGAFLEVGAINTGLGALLAPAVLGSAAAGYVVPTLGAAALPSGGASLLVRLVRRPAGAAAAVTVLVTALVGAALAAQPLLGGRDASGPGATGTTTRLQPAPESTLEPTLNPVIVPTPTPTPITGPAEVSSPVLTPSVTSPISPTSPPGSAEPTLPTPTLTGSWSPLPTTLPTEGPTEGPSEVPTEAPTETPTTGAPMTTEDLALSSGWHVFYSPHHHLEMTVDALVDPTILTFEVARLTSFDVHQDRDFVGTACATASVEPDGTTVLTCRLAAGSGTFAIDVVVDGPLDASARISAANNADPDPSNDVAEFVG